MSGFVKIDANQLMEENRRTVAKLQMLADSRVIFTDLNAQELPVEQLYQLADMGHKRLQYGRYEEAVMIFQSLTMIMPLNTYFQTALGATFQRMKKVDQAIAAYNTSIKLRPSANALVNRAECFLQKGKRAEAEQDLIQALELPPEQQGRHGQRAAMLYETLHSHAA